MISHERRVEMIVEETVLTEKLFDNILNSSGQHREECGEALKSVPHFPELQELMELFFKHAGEIEMEAGP
jgi:hypothetical protein